MTILIGSLRWYDVSNAFDDVTVMAEFRPVVDDSQGGDGGDDEEDGQAGL